MNLSLPQRSRFSALTRRIIYFNAVALILLLGATFVVETNGRSLIDERISAIRQQALIVSNTLGEYTTDEDTRTIKPEETETLLKQLIEPTNLRARIYDNTGKLMIDTRNLLPRNVVQTVELPPLDFWSRVDATWSRVYDGVMGVRPFSRLPVYSEGGNNGRIYAEVSASLAGEPYTTAERVDEQNKLVLSVAVPIQRFKAIYGVLMVSTEGGDIDGIVRAERSTLLKVFLAALIVMVGSSLYLSGFIAEPIRKLAQAADVVRAGRAGRESIPRMAERHDEIGDLSVSLSAMTQALYDRIDAIESFAADVAHELKNPLTSLKSAVETFSRAKDDASREKLMGIIRNDVKRIDRLISDVSDASRLDAELSREAVEPVDLERLLKTIVEIYDLTEIPRGVTLALNTSLPDGVRVIGRDERLGQIFRNLIDNSISFSPDQGIVTINAYTDGNTTRVIVADEGIGIPPDNLESVFKRFYTERPAEHGFGKNSGLGLSIARQIAEGVGGKVWAENREPHGARFIVELPIAK